MDEEREHLLLLVNSAAQGDRDAFTEIIKMFHSRLKYYIGRFTSDDDLRDDILQQIWISVFLDLKKLRKSEAFVVWLYRIAHNCLMVALKQKRGFQFRFPISLDQIQIEPVEEPDDNFNVEEAEWIHKGLAFLSPEHREVLVLRFIEDLDYEAIARIAKVGVGTIRSRLHYAKKALRDIIEREKRLQDE
jgi:RNA polymerase sigma-70 factor, ECF subfamily